MSVHNAGACLDYQERISCESLHFIRAENVAKLTYEAVQKQIAKLQAQAKTLEAARDTRKAKAVERVRALMKKLGVETSDLGAPVAAKRSTKARPGRPAAGGRKRKKTASSVPAKYRDPETEATWSGRGRTPIWLAKKIEEGKTRDDFLIRSE